MIDSRGTRTALLTIFAMLAFAGNSLLCRLALGQDLIDAASFTSVRVFAGAVTLAVMMLPRWRRESPGPVNWPAAVMLFVYMAGFSFAYRSLTAGTGALILFGAVQLTMIAFALRASERFSMQGWTGLAVALAGLAWLVAPGVTAPDTVGAIQMTVAGIAWGIYSLRGRNSHHALESTALNFICAVPLVLATSLIFIDAMLATPAGIGLAVVSGAITSGLGYVIWYAALPGLPATTASIVQLTVPVIAAFGGVAWLAEDMTPRLVVASIATLGGVWMVLSQRRKKN
ncbi:MAG: DMT family transporter [Woeseia sp.]|nr:DMT family transporter [Woeseia sp.]MBT8096342.1 DMT family transporter [Woeseia sp.]NNE59718.1 DMT family transporter [Woeseia sp.]NNL55824.1 DMT family transporter [Woeseia sp.]